jgi:hypothetical protein
MADRSVRRAQGALRRALERCVVPAVFSHVRSTLRGHLAQAAHVAGGAPPGWADLCEGQREVVTSVLASSELKSAVSWSILRRAAADCAARGDVVLGWTALACCLINRVVDFSLARTDLETLGTCVRNCTLFSCELRAAVQQAVTATDAAFRSTALEPCRPAFAALKSILDVLGVVDNDFADYLELGLDTESCGAEAAGQVRLSTAEIERLSRQWILPQIGRAGA